MSRRLFISGTAVAVGALTAVVGSTAPAEADVRSGGVPVEPWGRAGEFIEDPSQAGLSQSPSVAVHGDIAMMPLEVAF